MGSAVLDRRPDAERTEPGGATTAEQRTAWTSPHGAVGYRCEVRGGLRRSALRDGSTPSVRQRATRPTVDVAERTLLLRPRLTTRLRARFEAPLVVVIGGPGSGKTTVLAQAVEENRRHPAGTDVVLRCDATSRTPRRLAHALAAAVELDARAGVEEPSALAERALDHAAHRWPFGVAVIVDDAHVLAADGRSLLGHLVRVLPPPVHLVVAAREAPWLPQRSGTVVIDEQTLRFDAAEIADLATLRGVEATTLAELDGWPAVADLAATMGIAGAAAFVEEEVVARLDPALRHHLAVLSVLGEAPEDARTVALGEGAASDPAVRSLPLVRLEAQRPVVHAVWRRLLDDDCHAEPVRNAIARAATHLVATGRAGHAVDLALDVDDRGAVAASVAGLWRDLDVERWRPRLPAWIDAVAGRHRPARKAADPTLAVLRAISARVADTFGDRTY